MGAYLDKLPPGAQVRHRQWRSDARNQHQAQRLRPMQDQGVEKIMDGFALNGLVVVQHEDERLGQQEDLVAEPGDNNLQRR